MTLSTDSEFYDYVVVGAGIAGASVAYFLSREANVIVLEMEDQPGYHTTGRSAALFSEAYGNATIRALTTGGRAFFHAPPVGFTERPILTPRGALFIGREEQTRRLDEIADDASQLVDGISRLDSAEARHMVPVLRAERVAGGVFEPGAMDIDVALLHQGSLRGLRANGGKLRTRAMVLGLERTEDHWRGRPRVG